MYVSKYRPPTVLRFKVTFVIKNNQSLPSTNYSFITLPTLPPQKTIPAGPDIHFSYN